MKNPKKTVVSYIVVITGISVALFLFLGKKNKTVDISYSLFCLSFIGLYVFFAFRKRRALILNISIVLFLLGASEKYLQIRKPVSYWPYMKFINSPGYMRLSDIFDHTPSPNFVDTSYATFCDTVLYNVIIRTDKYGHRKTPQIKTNENTKSIVFFGCSFTYGHGINDDQVMANIVQKSVDSLYKVYNFACNGYGPHHMLAAIEKKIVDTIVKFEPKYFIYQGIIDHVRRAVGLNWEFRDPKYILNKNGEAEFAGNYTPEKEPTLIMKRIKESQLAGLFQKQQVDTTDIRLFSEIIKKSQKLLQQKYPNSEFHIIFHDVPYWKISTCICNSLNLPGIKLHKISDIIPDYYSNNSKYVIRLPYETHPNAKTNEILANYVLNNIVKKTKDKLKPTSH